MNEDTLSCIPENQPPKKRRPRLIALVCALVCVATVLALVNIDLRQKDDDDIITNSFDFIEHSTFYFSVLGGSSFLYRNPITLHVSDDDGEWEDIHFRISCDYGTIHCPDIGTMLAIGEPITVPNGTVIYWDYYGWDHVATEEELSNATLDNLCMTDDRIAYVNILIFSADNIVGYAILRMNTPTVEEYAEYAGKTVVHDESWWDGKYDPDTTVYCPGGDHIVRSRYKVELLESVCFPKVDGVYQKISEQYVSNRIAACKER